MKSNVGGDHIELKKYVEYGWMTKLLFIYF
jgi:hypothetical protein